MKRTTIVAGALAVLALAIAGAAFSASARASHSSAPARSTTGAGPTVAVAAVARGDVLQTTSIAGEFRPFQEIDLHAKVAGYLRTINVDVGSHVRGGELLAVLEVPELEEDLQQNAAGVKRASEEIRRARADLDRATSVHDFAHLGATRLASVIKAQPHLVAQQDIDEATARDHESDAQVATARAALAAATEQLEIAKASERKSRALVGYARITAPFTGVITHRYADPGAMIQAGTSSNTQAMPVVRLSQNNVLRLVVAVPESAVPSVRVGGSVQVGVQALNRSFSGTVARIADRLDSDTRTMRTEIDVPNPTGAIVPGMYATVDFTLQAARHVLVAPLEAVDRSEPAPRLFVVNKDHRIEVRAVRLGLEAPDRVEVADGVAEGDSVVISNRAALKPGQAVSPQIVSPAPAPAAASGGR